MVSVSIGKDLVAVLSVSNERPVPALLNSQDPHSQDSCTSDIAALATKAKTKNIDLLMHVMLKLCYRDSEWCNVGCGIFATS